MSPRRRDEQPVTLSVEIINETEKALLVVTEDGKEHWLPKSQIKDGHALGVDEGKQDLIIPRWLAENHGLE